MEVKDRKKLYGVTPGSPRWESMSDKEKELRTEITRLRFELRYYKSKIRYYKRYYGER